MKWNTKIAPVVCLAVLGTAIEARADCQNLRGAISETRIASPERPSGQESGQL